MYKISEEQRKQLLQYFWAKPYGEVASHIGMLASLVKIEKANSNMYQLIQKTDDKLLKLDLEVTKNQMKVGE